MRMKRNTFITKKEQRLLELMQSISSILYDLPGTYHEADYTDRLIAIRKATSEFTGELLLLGEMSEGNSDDRDIYNIWITYLRNAGGKHDMD